MPGFEWFGEKEKKQVQKVLDTGVLMRYNFEGPRKDIFMARALETGIQEKFNTDFAHVVSSGTAALSVALSAAGIGVGDEVIMPTFTFVASFEAILMLGAVPVLVDVDDTLTLCPETVLKSITPKTKVVMPVHMCGSMANLEALKKICTEHNLLLLEDACQAIGGKYQGKYLGTYGDLGCFSFDYVKTITCGEGGAVVTNNEDFYKNSQAYSDHGHDHIGNDRGAEDHPFLGYNFRISELNAAVGVAQLARFDEILQVQKQNYTTLRRALEDLNGIQFRSVPEGGQENYSFLNFYLPTPEMAKKAQKELSLAGVDACFYWFDNNWHYYRKWEHLLEGKSLGRFNQEVVAQLEKMKTQDFTQSDKWVSRNISCLIKLSWTTDQLEQRAKTMRSVLEKVLKNESVR